MENISETEIERLQTLLKEAVELFKNLTSNTCPYCRGFWPYTKNGKHKQDCDIEAFLIKAGN